ncbi:hypothetical protein B0O99DRAFT_605920 [Bisporella sp. PMI_857]|nr:hypothetical protein B0O99DRAFT_605920 [Bisporella sp. PMI_857]
MDLYTHPYLMPVMLLLLCFFRCPMLPCTLQTLFHQALGQPDLLCLPIHHRPLRE